MAWFQALKNCIFLRPWEGHGGFLNFVSRNLIYKSSLFMVVGLVSSLKKWLFPKTVGGAQQVLEFCLRKTAFGRRRFQPVHTSKLSNFAFGKTASPPRLSRGSHQQVLEFRFAERFTSFRAGAFSRFAQQIQYLPRLGLCLTSSLSVKYPVAIPAMCAALSTLFCEKPMRIPKTENINIVKYPRPSMSFFLSLS